MNNELINSLYNRIDAQEKIIRELQEERIKYKEEIDKAIELLDMMKISEFNKDILITLLKGNDNYERESAIITFEELEAIKKAIEEIKSEAEE